MDIEKGLSKETKDNAVDMTVTLVVEKISKMRQISPDEAYDLLASANTGKLLYDEESDLWQYGCAYIVEMLEQEIGRGEAEAPERGSK